MIILLGLWPCEIIPRVNILMIQCLVCIIYELIFLCVCDYALLIIVVIMPCCLLLLLFLVESQSVNHSVSITLITIAWPCMDDGHATEPKHGAFSSGLCGE